MKLTKYHKEAFVNAAMQDIPKVNHKEEFDKVVRADVYSQMPSKLKAVYDDESIRRFLATTYTYVAGCSCIGNVSIACVPDYKISAETLVAAKDIHDAFEIQNETLINARNMLEGAIHPYNTLKKALEALPLFAKYLPTEDEPTRNLPAVANLAQSLEALGWSVPSAT